jgi:hypothetical protein
MTDFRKFERRTSQRCQRHFCASAVYIALLGGRMVKLSCTPRNRREISYLRTEFLKI